MKTNRKTAKARKGDTVTNKPTEQAMRAVVSLYGTYDDLGYADLGRKVDEATGLPDLLAENERLRAIIKYLIGDQKAQGGDPGHIDWGEAVKLARAALAGGKE